MQAPETANKSICQYRQFAESFCVPRRLTHVAVFTLVLLTLARSVSAENTNSGWSVPIELQRGRVMVPVTINNSQKLTFLLDSGYGISMIHPRWLEPLGLRRAGTVTIIGIAGDEDAGMYAGADFQIGKATFSPRRIASLPSEARSRRRRDGILGVEFFRHFVVELDAQHKTLRLHEPQSFNYAGKGEILPLTFPRDTPVIDATIETADKKQLHASFEVDTGCDGALCLGSPFVKANQLTDEAESGRAGVRTGVGGGMGVMHGHLPRLLLGRLAVENPSTSFFLDGSPVDEPQAGHIGMEALRQFKVIFDYSRKRMILEKNH